MMWKTVIQGNKIQYSLISVVFMELEGNMNLLPSGRNSDTLISISGVGAGSNGIPDTEERKIEFFFFNWSA